MTSKHGASKTTLNTGYLRRYKSFFKLMSISSESLKRYAGENLLQRKYKEGDRLERSKFTIQCGINEEKSRSGIVNFTALCLTISHFKEKPHEINGEFTERGEILFWTCSCAAGLDGKCKHIVSVLIYLERREEALEVLSCTDKKCAWKKSFEEALVNFEPAPLMFHNCYANMKKQKTEKTIIDENKNIQDSQMTAKRRSLLKELNTNELADLHSVACGNLEKSAIARDKYVISKTSKRHSLKAVRVKTKVSDREKTAFELIFQNQNSELMKIIQDLPFQLTGECCKGTLQNLNGDFIQMCENTTKFYDSWQTERRKRITGSICYGIYTYTKNKNANWEKKCKDTFTPKDFKSEYTEYGKITEEETRKAYINLTKKTVVETGLIVSNQNPWLAYSPDGVIFCNGKPSGVLEIKCPVVGKKADIQETVHEQMKTFFTTEGENIVLRKRHRYYGQVQLGMAVLNDQYADFVVYSSFDKKLFILKVAVDELFIINMLTQLKKIYFTTMVHYLCLKKRSE